MLRAACHAHFVVELTLVLDFVVEEVVVVEDSLWIKATLRLQGIKDTDLLDVVKVVRIVKVIEVVWTVWSVNGDIFQHEKTWFYQALRTLVGSCL